jgi:lysophospholipase L1-like esterase
MGVSVKDSSAPEVIPVGTPADGWSSRPLSRKKKALFGIIVVVVGCLTGLFLLEMAVRVRQWTRYGSMRSVEDTFTFDPVARLRVPIAGKTTGSIRINSLGFRSPELAVPKPIGVVRLAFLGGSTTYCAEVSSNEMTWPHLVWQSLSAALPESRLDYINAGVPGFSVEHLLLNLEKRVRPLAPDVIVIYEATNDFSSDSRELAIGQGLVDRGSPFRESWLSKYSLLWFLLERNLTIWRLQAAVQDTARKLAYEPRQLSRGFERRLTELVRAGQEMAPVVAVAGFSARLRRAEAPDTQREAAITALYYMPYMTLDGLISGYEEYNRVIREVALHTGALYIGGEDSIPPDSAHYTDSVHFTDAGSRAMARRVSEALLGGSAFRRLLGRKTAAGGRRIYAEPAAAH